MEEPIKEMLPVEEMSPEKENEVALNKNYTDLPQDVELWPSIIMNALETMY